MHGLFRVWPGVNWDLARGHHNPVTPHYWKACVQPHVNGPCNAAAATAAFATTDAVLTWAAEEGKACQRCQAGKYGRYPIHPFSAGDQLNLLFCSPAILKSSGRTVVDGGLKFTTTTVRRPAALRLRSKSL